MVTRHAFLAMLHSALRPRLYLEIGVHNGDSLRLAHPDTRAIGIDPSPQQAAWDAVGRVHNAGLFTVESDLYFEYLQTGVVGPLPSPIDLAFIDGLHLAEQALRDFINCERHSHPAGVIVLDDVLPYNAEIATRVQPPGDWTGDVWKVIEVLRAWRPDLTLTLVDSQPTGLCVITRLDPANTALSGQHYDDLVGDLTEEEPPPAWALHRLGALPATQALLKITEGR